MMHSEQLEQQLAAYAGFLDEVSRDRIPDLTRRSSEIDGDVNVVELMARGIDGDVAGGDSTKGSWSDRMPWLVALAAAAALIAALAFLIPGAEEGSLETIEPPELESEPELTELVEEEVSTPPSIGKRLEEATSLESTELLNDLYSQEVSVSFDNVDLARAGTDPFQFVTDMSMAELIDVRFTDCTDTGTEGSLVFDCRWSVDFTLLDGTVPAQHGSATIQTSEEKITQVTMTSDNLDDVVSALTLYRTWVSENVQEGDRLFTTLGTLTIHPSVVDAHTEAAAGFLAATDVQLDSANIGTAVELAIRSGDEGTVRRVFADRPSWVEPKFTLLASQFFAFMSGDHTLGRDLARFDFDECVAVSDSVSCVLTLSYPSIAGLGSVPGTVEIIADGGRAQTVNIDFDEAEYGEFLQRVVDYRTWLSEVNPAIVSALFIQDDLLNCCSASLAHHDRYGPEWSATLEG